MRPIQLRGARVHNLKGIDLDLEPGSLIAITGPSGAGKSSLAFSTLYAEGQRRYVESFSAYARQFLERLARPDVTSLDAVPAAIAVDRQAPVKTSRSTVGTMTELTDHAKELWATSASLVCPTCAIEVSARSASDCVDQVLREREGQRVVISYDCEARDREHFLGVRDGLIGAGYRRLWVAGETRDLDQLAPSQLLPEPNVGATLSVIVDRLRVQARDRSRLVEAFEAALARGKGDARLHAEDGSSQAFSNRLRCRQCATEYRRPSAALFSYNSPVGACEACRGFGRTIGIDWDKVIPDHDKTLEGGAIRPWLKGDSTVWERRLLKKRAKEAGIPIDKPFRSLTKTQRDFILNGDGGDWHQGWFGVKGWFAWLETRAYKMHVRVLLSRYRSYDMCTQCNGARLKRDAWSWKLGGLSLPELYALPVTAALDVLAQVTLPHADDRLRKACCDRLAMLRDVGLGYLTLDRAARSLSGGELQRVALTGALSASLTGALFVLDEPTVGLHPADVAQLATVVRRLPEGGNIALVVEHDTAMIALADRVIELGEGAGEAGGRVVFDGTPQALMKAHTKTAQALKPATRAHAARRAPTAWLMLSGASGNNLRSVDVTIPIGAITCVTGVSGSGKSSLVIDTLYAAVAAHVGKPESNPLPFRALSGHTGFKDAVLVDQAPMGRTSRGNPATFLGTWDHVRALFAAQPLAQERGYTAGTFSFNVEGGRCETCRGEGAETVEMQFLADVAFSCPDCGGRRFVGPVLDVQVRGKTIADVLELSATDAFSFFDQSHKAERGIRESLASLIDVGAGYLRLGQALSTLSGGEGQRLKLAAELRRAESALIVLDEPTAGLHPSDVAPLLTCLERLVRPDTAIVIVEHDMRVAAFCDHVIEIGPGAGAEGGTIVASGTPEQVAAHAQAPSAQFLARALGNTPPMIGKAKPKPAARPTPSRPHGIHLSGAREHNLKDVSLTLPHEQLVVITGPSGSGKSTLAFDIVFAEGQRRYLETLSPYARQYLPQLPRPHVDEVTGVPPAVSLEQRTTTGGVNSTVATITEIAHYVRLLFARVGSLSCPDCKLPIAPRQPALLADDVKQRFGKRAVTVLAPIVRGRKGEHNELIRKAIARGCHEARIDGTLQAIDAHTKLVRAKEHDVEAVVGRIAGNAPQLLTLLQTALSLGEGAALVIGDGHELWLSSRQSCSRCGRGFPVLDPRHFSFNTRQGACPTCEGRGAVERTRGRGKKAVVVHVACDDCGGKRLAGLSRHVTVAGHTIDAWLSVDVDDAITRLSQVSLAGRAGEIGQRLVDEAVLRLRFLQRVGLGYLELDRSASTLSGGEMQRVRLAAQLGSGLTGVLYVLDEPTIGLHPRDTGRLLQALRDLVNAGCSVLVVEHDADTIRSADHLIDVGPGGGHLGGRILGQGKPAELLAHSASVTGEALSRPMPDGSARRSTKDASWLQLSGASEHNLKDVSVRVPLGRLTAVTGVSGSGKSTLVRDVLLRAVRQALALTTEPPGAHQKLTGLDGLKRAVEIDQSPIGRTPRSVPATYIGVWDELRKLYAMTPLARSRGYTASRFSFNSNAGRCAVCEGQGQTSVEMSFLPQVSMPCDACEGKRFNQETLEVRLHGTSAGELLDMDIDQVIPIVSAFPKVQRPLALLSQLGLGYLKLGQASNTLSGGEAQRLKLVSELSTAGVAGTLYVMDEPTTGLHRNDVHRLLSVLQALVDQGATVIVIEHQPDVIMAADWVIDLGPEGGRGGGTLVAEGTPDAIMKHKPSHTGRALIEERARVAEAHAQRS